MIILNNVWLISIFSTKRKIPKRNIAKIVISNGDKLDDIYAEIDAEPLMHDVTTPETREPHIQEMIMEGLTDEQMLELHPEINQADIDAAKQALLENDNG